MSAKRPAHILIGILLLYLLALLVMSVPAALLWRAGELYTAKEIADMQLQQDDLLWGGGFNDPRKKNKVLAAGMRNPELLVLGNSRVLPFRKEFFNDEHAFYNAGNGIKILSQYQVFLEALPKQPKVLLLGIDDFMFAPGWSNLDDTLLGPDIFTERSRFAVIKDAYQDIYTDLVSGKLSAGTMLSHPGNRIGCNAIFKQSGFRPDGSWYYGGFIHDPASNPDAALKETRRMIVEGETHYVHARTPREAGFNELRALLAYCRQHNIQTVAIMPPYAPTAYHMMDSMQEAYGYKKGLATKLKQLFNEYGFQLYDYSDAAALGGTDAMFFDGHHASESLCGRIAVSLADSSAVLRPYISRQMPGIVHNNAHPLYLFKN